jgi:hypothetical protein
VFQRRGKGVQDKIFVVNQQNFCHGSLNIPAF